MRMPITTTPFAARDVTPTDTLSGRALRCVWQLDVEGAEFSILASLVAACEARPSLWPRRIVYEQKHAAHAADGARTVPAPCPHFALPRPPWAAPAVQPRCGRGHT